MLIGVTWRKGANLEIQVDDFDGGKVFPRVITWSWLPLRS